MTRPFRVDPHDVTVVDEATGREEHFTVTITADGMAEWLRDRTTLVAQGKPDRPPDLDSEMLRYWIMRPGEEVLPHFLDLAGRDIAAASAEIHIGSWAWQRPADDEWLLIAAVRRPDGSVRVDGQMSKAGRHSDPELFEREFSDEVAFEQFVAESSTRLMLAGYADPAHVSQSDFSKFLLELARADRDAA
jgi:hypothetical protein